MNILITTRSMNPELYNMAQEFWPKEIDRIKYINFNHWSDAKTYLEEIIKSYADFVINIDEDCFVFNFNEIYQIIKIMQRQEFTHYGMPDCAEFHPQRKNHQHCMNPFFNIFNVKLCRAALTKPAILKRQSNESEIFNDFFFRLHDNGDAFVMPALMHKDKISSYNHFLIHTWYSRDWNFGQKQRITERYNEAKSLLK